jgi:hypothetical protein
MKQVVCRAHPRLALDCGLSENRQPQVIPALLPAIASTSPHLVFVHDSIDGDTLNNMEYYPIDPANYGVTVASTKPAPSINDVRRKRQRDESSSKDGCNSEHGGLSSTSSAALDTSATKRQRTGESGEVNQIGEATANTSSSSKAASSSMPAAAPTSSTPDSVDARRLEKLAAQEQRREERWKRNSRAAIARDLGHEVDSDGERQYWQDLKARCCAEEARRKALSPEVSSIRRMLSNMICSSALGDLCPKDCISPLSPHVKSAQRSALTVQFK